MTTEPDDHQLLRAFSHEGSQEAFAVLARRHAGLLFHAALRRTGRADLAEEAAQNALAVLARKASVLRPGPSLAPWLHRTVCFEAARLHRRERRHDLRERRHFQDSTVIPGPDPVSDSWETMVPHLDEALNGLSGPDRQVLLLKYFEGWSFEEMAQRLGGQAAAWRQRGSRALKHLRHRLARRGVVMPLTALTAGLHSALCQPAPAAVPASLATVPVIISTSLLWKTIALSTLHAMTAKQATIAAVIVLAAVLVPAGFRAMRPPAPLQTTGGPAGKSAIPLPPPAAFGRTAPEPKAWPETFKSFTGMKDSLERQRRLLQALDGINAENWGEILGEMEKSRGLNEMTHEEALLFLRRLGECGKEKLAIHCRPADVVNGWETHLARYALAGWAAKEPDASWAFLNTLPEGKYRQGLMWGWFEAMSTQQPDRALREARHLDLDSDVFILNTLAAGVAAYDPAKVRPWLEEIARRPAATPATAEAEAAVMAAGGSQAKGWENGTFHSGPRSGIDAGREFFSQMLRERLTMAWSPEYVAGIKDWYDQFHGSEAVPADAMGKISQALSQSKPAPEVLDWIGSHSASPEIHHAASNIVSRWTDEANADEVVSWLEAHHDSPAYDGAAAGFAAKAKNFDPAGAKAWASTVKDDQTRGAVLRYLMDP